MVDQAQIDYMNLYEKYAEARSELLDVKLHLRCLLNYPEGDPSPREMMSMLQAKMTRLEMENRSYYAQP